MNRYGRHIIFWVLSAIFLIATLGYKQGQFLPLVVFVCLLLPIAIGTSLILNHYLLPRFLFNGKYLQFGLYSFLTLTISAYLTILFILGILVWQGNTFDNMPFSASNAKSVGVSFYFIVMLYTLIHLIRNREKAQAEQEEFITVISERKSRRIKIEEITFIESLSDYIQIHTLDNLITTKQKISHINTVLPDNFIRVHRSFIINKQHVDSYTKEHLDIRNTKVPISRTYKKMALDALSS